MEPSFGQLEAAPADPALLTETFASPEPVLLVMFVPDDAKEIVSFAKPAGLVTAVTVNVPFSAATLPVKPLTVTRSLIAKLCPSATTVATLLDRLAEVIVHEVVTGSVETAAPAVPAALSVAPPPPAPPAATNCTTSFLVTTDAAPPPPPAPAQPVDPRLAPVAPP